MSEKHYRVEYPSQQETVMTIKLTEKLLNQLKNASSSSITISFHKGKATLVFDREIVTLTDRKEKKKHQCFVEDPTTHTFKAIGFISRKLHPQQTLTQSIQEKVITSFRNTEEKKPFVKPEIVESENKLMKVKKNIKIPPTSPLNNRLKTSLKRKLSSKFTSTSKSLSLLDSSNNSLRLSQKRTQSTTVQTTERHRDDSNTSKVINNENEPVIKRPRLSSKQETLPTTTKTTTTTRVLEQKSLEVTPTTSASTFNIVIEDLEKLEFEEQTKPERKSEIKTVEELRNYQAEWNEKYPLYKKIYQVLQQNSRDFVRLEELYKNPDTPLEKKIQIADKIEELFNRRKGEIHRLRTKYRMLHEELSSLRNRINQFISQHSGKSHQQQQSK